MGKQNNQDTKCKIGSIYDRKSSLLEKIRRIVHMERSNGIARGIHVHSLCLLHRATYRVTRGVGGGSMYQDAVVAWGSAFRSFIQSVFQSTVCLHVVESR